MMTEDGDVIGVVSIPENGNEQFMASRVVLLREGSGGHYVPEDRYDEYIRLRREYVKSKSGLEEVLFPGRPEGDISISEPIPSFDEVFERACSDVDVWSSLIRDMVKDHLRQRMEKINEARLRAMAELRSFGSE